MKSFKEDDLIGKEITLSDINFRNKYYIKNA